MRKAVKITVSGIFVFLELDDGTQIEIGEMLTEQGYVLSELDWLLDVLEPSQVEHIAINECHL